MSNNYNTPVNRNSLFYSQEDFDLETNWVLDYMEQDTNQTIILYEVDKITTQTDDIYKESKANIRFKPPKEIPCIYEIEDAQMKSYDSKTNNGVYSLSGNLKFTILLTTLQKYNCDINRGDYIGVLIDNNRMSYFVVYDDGKMNTANKNLMGAFKVAYRNVACSPVSDDEFNGK